MPSSSQSDSHPDVPTVSVTPTEKLENAASNLRAAVIRPRNWSRKSSSPYFREKFAIDFRDNCLEPMIEDKQTRIYYYEEWPSLKPSSLYNKIIQSKLYLLEYLDLEKKYATFCRAVYIKPKKGVGIVVSVMKDIIDEMIAENPKPFRPSLLSSGADNWHNRVMDYIENGKVGEPLVLKNLALEETDIAQLTIELSALTNFALSVQTSYIKLVKIS